jgi:hypothetical protein
MPTSTTIAPTPEAILERARVLEAQQYEDMPIWLLLGRAWIDDEPLRLAYRSLKTRQILVDCDAPGFVRLA